MVLPSRGRITVFLQQPSVNPAVRGLGSVQRGRLCLILLLLMNCSIVASFLILPLSVRAENETSKRMRVQGTETSPRGGRKSTASNHGHQLLPELPLSFYL